jgi:hypothetical protein
MHHSLIPTTASAGTTVIQMNVENFSSISSVRDAGQENALRYLRILVFSVQVKLYAWKPIDGIDRLQEKKKRRPPLLG